MSLPVQKYPDEVYLACDVYGGDDSDVRCKSTKIVTIRKAHSCWLCPKARQRHSPGERMYRETAIVDGSWQTNYTCLPCCERECVDDMVRSGCLPPDMVKRIEEWQAVQAAARLCAELERQTFGDG